MRNLLFTAGLLLLSQTSFAKVKLVTTVTDIRFAAEVIGGDKVEVSSFLSGYEDPHHIDAVPKYITMAANADIVCSVGLGLEIGWLPRVLQKSGNRNIQRGGKGFCELGMKVNTLNKPVGRIDRSMGDVHPEGNPHFWLGPTYYYKASEIILNTLISVDPKNAEYYLKGYEKLKVKTDKILADNKAVLAKALGKDRPLMMEYHQEFAYFFKDYGLQTAGAVEELPGVPPSAARVIKAALDAKSRKVKLVFAGLYAPKNILERFHELSQIPVAVVSTSVLADKKEWKDYETSQRSLIKTLIEKRKK